MATAKRARAKPRAKTAKTEIPAKTGTGLFVLCPAARWDSDHRAFVEVRECRNSAHHIHCPGCRFTGFMRDNRWKAEGASLETIQRTMLWQIIYPAYGSAIVAPRMA